MRKWVFRMYKIILFLVIIFQISQCKIGDRKVVCNKHFNQKTLSKISILLGPFGFDRLITSYGNPVSILKAFAKFITVGGLGVWYVSDLYTIQTGRFIDGNGETICL